MFRITHAAAAVSACLALSATLVSWGAPPATPANTPANTPAAKSAAAAPTDPPPSPATPPQPTAASARQSSAESLEEARLALSKWIETQQIISKERNEWQQGKEILQGRIELVAKEVTLLKERITQSEKAVADSQVKRDELLAERDRLKAVAAQLAESVAAMEVQIRALSKLMPEPVATKIAPLIDRIPLADATTRVSTAERFQNVLGILNELNKANSEITLAYEIRTLADGTTSEVQVIYLGLAHAYFLSPRGEAGIGQPSPEGWKWAPAPKASAEILAALEVFQGKSSPAFVPLPITIQ